MKTGRKTSESMIGELAALGAALSWTISAVLYRKALAEAKPVAANTVRLAFTSIFLLVFMAASGKFAVFADLPVNVVILASISGIIGLGVGDTLYMASLKVMGVAKAVPITCTYPLFTILWAVLFIGEPVTLPIVLGAVTITAGIWLLGKEDKADANAQHKHVLAGGVSLALATAIVWSVSITMINMAVRKTGSLDAALAINTIRVAVVAASMLALVPVADPKLGLLKLRRKTLAALVVGGIVALGLGWFFLTYSFVETLESRAVPISSTTPLFSTLCGIVLLHEKITRRSAFGSAAVVIGIFLIFVT